MNNPIQKLHQLTLSLEEAVATEDWLSIHSHLNAREEILLAIKSSTTDQKTLSRVIAADKRCQERLQGLMLELLKKLKTTYHQKQATTLYAPDRNSSAKLLEQQG